MNSRPRPGISERPRSSASRPGVSRTGAGRSHGSARPQSGRPTGTRTQSGSRYQGSRYEGTRPAGYRAGGSRNRRRKRKTIQPRFFLLLAILVIIVAAIFIIIPKGGKTPTPNGPMATPTIDPNNGSAGNVSFGNETIDESAAVIQAPAADSDTLAEQLNDSETQVGALAESDRIQVSSVDLSVNTSLPSEWMNILLLGTDERVPNDAARTDAMIICSINKNTGEVKLISVARDTQIKITGTNKFDGDYRINALNYFGGPLYAIKFLNEKLNLNIQYYVTVNFFGFQQIAEQMGGIEVDITEAEMAEINTKQYYQAWLAASQGIDESNIPNETLTTFGPNTHLNGRQTLAYARVRYVDSDFSRMERQRTVLIKMMEKLRGKSLAELTIMASTLTQYITTNIDLNTILDVATIVMRSNVSGVKTTRIPINGTYKEERRNDKDMLWDTDWAANATEVYNIIYT